MQNPALHQPASISSARPSTPTVASGAQDASRLSEATPIEFMSAKGALKESLRTMYPGAPKALRRRIKDSNEVMARHMTGATKFVFKLEGAPVGLMSVDVPERGGVKITGLVTHPSSKGVGGALVEDAVKLSMASNRDGLVELQFLPNPGRKVSPAKLAYEALGFVSDGGLTMKLDPSKRPDKWQQDANGDWKLKKGPPFMDQTG